MIAHTYDYQRTSRGHMHREPDDHDSTARARSLRFSADRHEARDVCTSLRLICIGHIVLMDSRHRSL